MIWTVVLFNASEVVLLTRMKMYILYRTGYLQLVCGLWTRGNNHHQLKGIHGGKCGEWLKVEGWKGVNCGRGQTLPSLSLFIVLK